MGHKYIKDSTECKQAGGVCEGERAKRRAKVRGSAKPTV
jgi:hypothetical protein